MSQLRWHRGVSRAEITAAADSFRRERGLSLASDTRTWLERQSLTDDDFAHLARIEALLDKLLEFYEPSLSREATLGLELRRQGRFAALADQAARTRDATSSKATEKEALAWHTREVGPIVGSLDAHARRRGFRSQYRTSPWNASRRPPSRLLCRRCAI